MQLPTLSTLRTSSNVNLARLTSLAIPIGSIIVSVLIILLIVRPKFMEVFRLRASNQELSVRVQSLQQKIEKLENLDRGELEQQLTAAEQLLPSDKGVFSLVGQIEKSAAASGVLLSRIEVAPGSLSESLPEKPAPAPSDAGEGTDVGDVAQKVQLKVSLSSDYKSLLQFLNNMLSLSRVITIRDLSVSAASSSSGESSQIRISLAFDAYWKPLPKQLASIESPIAELTPSESARLENVQLTGFVTPPTVPEVPKGKPDLFTPF